MADGQYLLCSIFLQRLRWSAYWWLDVGSSGYSESDANTYGDCYIHTDTNPNSYSHTDTDSCTNRDCERNTDIYSAA